MNTALLTHRRGCGHSQPGGQVCACQRRGNHPVTVARVGALSDVITHPPRSPPAARTDRPQAAVDEQPAMATTTASNSRPAKPPHPRSAQGRPKTSVT